MREGFGVFVFFADLCTLRNLLYRPAFPARDRPFPAHSAAPDGFFDGGARGRKNEKKTGKYKKSGGKKPPDPKYFFKIKKDVAFSLFLWYNICNLRDFAKYTVLREKRGKAPPVNEEKFAGGFSDVFLPEFRGAARSGASGA